MALPSLPEHNAATVIPPPPPLIGDVVVQTWTDTVEFPIPMGWTISKNRKFIMKVWTAGDIWPLRFEGWYVVLRPYSASERL